MKPSDTGKKTNWVMPEEKAKSFSIDFLVCFKNLAWDWGVTCFSIEVWKKYDGEDTPCLHLEVEFGSNCDKLVDCAGILTLCSETSNGEKREGKMKISFKSNALPKVNQILELGALHLCNEGFKNHYLGWNTEYRLS